MSHSNILNIIYGFLLVRDESAQIEFADYHTRGGKATEVASLEAI